MRCLFAAGSLLVLGLVTSLSAAEHGRGLGRALSQAGKSVSAPGLNKASTAGSSLSRAGNGLGRAGGLQRAPGLARGPLGKGLGKAKDIDSAAVNGPKDPAVQHEKQLQIEQRNRDHRLAQAQKLRALAEKNGDAELLANADRMEAAATDHYQQRVEQLGRFGVTDLSLNPPQGNVVVNPQSSTPDLDINVDAPSLDTATQPARTAARSGLKPRWWGAR